MTANIPSPTIAGQGQREKKARGWTSRLLTLAVITVVVVSGYRIHQAPPYSPAHGLGYWLGLLGGSMMLVLLLYPVRKRLRNASFLGALKHWFKLHMVAGIAGPACVLYHTTFHVGSFNAAIALASMLLVVFSGIAGRFIYRKIHHGLFGSRASLQELQSILDAQLNDLQAILVRHPQLQQEMDRFLALLAQRPTAPLARLKHFLSLGWSKSQAMRRLRKGIVNTGARELADLAEILAEALNAAQKAAQFSTYERLFSLWHVVHIPFLWMLLITAIIHVLAVHAY